MPRDPPNVEAKYTIVDRSEGDTIRLELQRDGVTIASAIVEQATGLAAMSGMSRDAIVADFRGWLEERMLGGRSFRG